MDRSAVLRRSMNWWANERLRSFITPTGVNEKGLTSVNKSAQRKAFRAAFAFELNPDSGTENFCFRHHLLEQNPDSETGN